jgi:hypothetical protein
LGFECPPTGEEIIAILGTGVKTVQTGRQLSLIRLLSLNPFLVNYVTNVKARLQTIHAISKSLLLFLSNAPRVREYLKHRMNNGISEFFVNSDLVR